MYYNSVLVIDFEMFPDSLDVDAETISDQSMDNSILSFRMNFQLNWHKNGRVMAKKKYAQIWVCVPDLAHQVQFCGRLAGSTVLYHDTDGSF